MDALNAPTLQRRRLASIKAIALDLAAKKGTSPADAFAEAMQALAQAEGGIAYRAAVKKQRAGRTYAADGTAAHAASRYVAAVALQVAARARISAGPPSALIRLRDT
jgi:hypothetical protein